MQNTTMCIVYGSWWRHQMEIFSALLALCEGNPPVTGHGIAPIMTSLECCVVYGCADDTKAYSSDDLGYILTDICLNNTYKNLHIAFSDAFSRNYILLFDSNFAELCL